MKIYILLLLILANIIFINSINAQTQQDKDKAEKIFNKAISEYDNGRIDEAILLLKDCLELDSDNSEYIYELGLCYYKLQNYEKAIKTCKKLIKLPDCNFQPYQLIGNSYDLLGYPEKALKFYNKGLKRFPESGRLYFEIAIVYLGQNDIKEAIKHWELAVDTEPEYSSSYYYLTKVFSMSSEPMWAILYGEIFMNLEKKTKRTLEISKILYDLYKNSITFEENGAKISMTKNINMEYMPFTLHFELGNVLSSIAMEKTFSIKTLIELRKKFVEIWNEKFIEQYPLPSVIFHNKLMENNLFEAYNYWLFNAGNKDEFNTWYEANINKFEELDKWMGNNQLTLDSVNHFSRNVIIKQNKE